MPEMLFSENDLLTFECKHLKVQAFLTAERFKETQITLYPSTRCDQYDLSNEHVDVKIFQRASCQYCFEDFILVEKTKIHKLKKTNIVSKSDPCPFEIMTPSTCHHPVTALDIMEETFTATKPITSKSLHSYRYGTNLKNRIDNVLNSKTVSPRKETKKEAILYAHANCRLCGVKRIVVENKCTLGEINGEIKDIWQGWIVCE